MATTDKPGKGLKVPFGRKDDRLLAPTDSLAAGLDCQCCCPGCGARLVLKQGSKRRFFAHYNAPGSDHCVESAIHAAAKQVLIECGGLMVPEFSFHISAATEDGGELHEYDVLSPQRRIRFDRTIAEVAIETIRPDVVGYRADRQLLVEMFFRHRVDEEKRVKLKQLGFPALEIDLSDLDPMEGFEAVKERVIEGVHHKEWLLYPRSDQHLAYLQLKLKGRVDAANDKHRADFERQRLELIEQARLEKARLRAKVDIDNAFSRWPANEQEGWLRERLGLDDAIPAFLSRRSFPETVLQVPAFLFQASIFERYIHRSQEGTKLTANMVYPCLQRRFRLPADDRMFQCLAINMYLHYLAKANFLDEAGRDWTGPYYVRHSDVSLPRYTSVETRYDGEPLLSEEARGTGPRRRWRTTWPRWRSVRDDAHEILAGSPYRDQLLDALECLSSTNRPSSPHHWAAPLVAQGVPLECCLDLLSVAGLIEG